MAGSTSVEAQRACQVSSWYRAFEHLVHATQLIPLPPDFVDFLVEDGIHAGNANGAFPSGTDNSRFTSTSEEESTDGSEGEDSDARVRDYQQEFSSLLADVNSAIEELGGKVAPKLNWSAPLDAVWMLPGRSLKCENADEVVMLLKSSDRVAHDICHAFDHCPGGPSLPRPDFFLALRKWYDLRPEGEFRAFVRSQELVGASQRDVSQPFAMAAGQRATVRELLLEFHKSHIQNVFPLGDYTYDVYITSSNRVKLIDFNPIGGSTSPLLFTWCELGYLPKMDSNADGIAEAAMATTEDKSSSRQHSDLPGGFGGSPPIRVVGDQSGMMLGQQVAYGMPFDMIGCSVEDMVKAMGAEEGAMG